MDKFFWYIFSMRLDSFFDEMHKIAEKITGPIPLLSKINKNIAVGRVWGREHPDYKYVITAMDPQEITDKNLTMRIPGKKVLNIGRTDVDGCFTNDDIHKAIQFYQEAKSKGEKTFVHCNKGRSRSPALAVALLKSDGMNTDKAIELVKKKRPIAEPRPGNIQTINNYFGS